MPGIFTEEPEFYHASELGGIDESDDAALVGQFVFPEEERVIINPGSVGQPRDHDPRASFAILDMNDEHAVSFYRVEYDIEVVATRILEIEALSPWLAERLYKGV